MFGWERFSHSSFITLDIFPFISNSWYLFTSVGLFRYTIWVYFNDSKPEDIVLSLYIYGRFDNEHNPEKN